MVSIVSTAQASLLSEDAYNKKTRVNSRSCGVWGTAFCCLNLKWSVVVIAIMYGVMYLLSNIGVLVLGVGNQLNIVHYGWQNIWRNALSFITFGIEKKLFGHFDKFSIISEVIIEKAFLRIILNILEVSCYTNGIIFVLGILTGIFGWFWLTAILLVSLWIESIKSVSSIVYITYLLTFILKSWYLKVAAIIISALFLLVTYSFLYYSIQIVYSLYLVQLAGGRGDEYVAYYKLRRLFQNIGVSDSSQLTAAISVERNILKNTDEVSPLIRVNQDTMCNGNTYQKLV
ncbi:hypothetical protein OJ252_1871 [Cryptosporidium canis]|uniref:Uncharacterized protein n=1 Tax=Cryptosporidium canis TaxID=195482 RepID=A0ABQ8P6S1_9CRYT|nr:hypothetical protein OJ252_1871 [Cryptosporidium canis]